MARLPGGRKKKGKTIKRVAGTAALLAGAAGLALFIVGARRRYRLDADRVVGEPEDEGGPGGGPHPAR
jgi:hypothetical protein